MKAQDQLERLAQVHADIERMQGWLPNLVRMARHGGASWTQIGTAIGVTKQAAQQKYGYLEALPGKNPSDPLWISPIVQDLFSESEDR